MAKRRSTVDANLFARTKPEGDQVAEQDDASPERQGAMSTGRQGDMVPGRQGDTAPSSAAEVDQAPPVKMAFYLSPEVADALERRYSQDRRQASRDGTTDRRKVSRSAIVEAALRAYLEGRGGGS